MTTIIKRRYCLTHPRSMIQLFGVGLYLSMLVGRNKSLLERSVEFHELHGFAMPGHVGRAYRLAALIEFRVAQVYGRLAERFAAQPLLADFFRELQAEELEHGRLMELCRHTVTLHPGLRYLPSIFDPAIKGILRQLSNVRARIDAMSADEALLTTLALEEGEINTIFERLLKQTERQETRLFEERMLEMEDHAEVVPKRVMALRYKLEALETGTQKPD